MARVGDVCQVLVLWCGRQASRQASKPATSVQMAIMRLCEWVGRPAAAPGTDWAWPGARAKCGAVRAGRGIRIILICSCPLSGVFRLRLVWWPPSRRVSYRAQRCAGRGVPGLDSFLRLLRGRSCCWWSAAAFAVDQINHERAVREVAAEVAASREATDQKPPR